LVDGGNIAVGTSFGIVVGKEADILKFPAEGCKKKKMVRRGGLLSGDKDAVEPPLAQRCNMIGH
jgi:hypothetical protein